VTVIHPTPEQLAICEAGMNSPENLQIIAYAGTGKTSTLEMLETVLPQKPILYLVFNRKNKEEAEKRMKSTTTCKTLNGIGHTVWQNNIPKKVTLEKKKTQDILRGIIDEIPKNLQGTMWGIFWDVVAGVNTAKVLGYVPNGVYPNARRLIDEKAFHAALDEDPDDLIADTIDAVLTRAIKAAYAGSLDHNDQVYMPALFGSTFPRYPVVQVDEAQDLNPVNHALLDKLVKQRFVCVGDPFQSIYGFRGAVQGGMETLAGRFSTESHTLSVSFRCPRAIVEAARWRVPGFQWVKEGGHVEKLLDLAPGDIPENAAILCRNNAPLFACALRLLMAGRGVSVAGSDIGPKLIAIMRKLGDESMTRAQVLIAIDSWLANKEKTKSASAFDIAACMRVFAEHGANLGQAIAYADHLLKQTGTIRLMTGHKSKGLEFSVVYHLDPWIIDEFRGRSSNPSQEDNLRYVIQTRSLDKYYEIDSDRIRW
jgi:superfamily I DNA/RNA helicase